MQLASLAWSHLLEHTAVAVFLENSIILRECHTEVFTFGLLLLSMLELLYHPHDLRGESVLHRVFEELTSKG